MENENYIMLNGKKIPLTDEQIELIQSDLPEKSPFDRVKEGETYYYFNHSFDVYDNDEDRLIYDDDCYRCANYCTDEGIMKQHALQMLRYSMTHGGDKINLDDDSELQSVIEYNAVTGEFGCLRSSTSKFLGDVLFASEETAKAAIEEIVKPFIAEHPDFDLTKM